MNINDYNRVTDRIKPADRCRNEVLNMNKRQKKNIRMTKKGAAAIVAVAIAACGGTAAFAAERFGAFDKLSDTLSHGVQTEYGEIKVDKYDKTDYSSVAAAAQSFAEPFTLEGDNVTMTVGSVYCDGNTLILGMTGSLKNGNPEGFQYIRFTPTITYNDKSFNFGIVDDELLQMTGKLYLDEGTENSFTGRLLLSVEDSAKFTGATDVQFRIGEVRPNNEPYGNEGGPLCTKAPLEDEFEFSLNIAPDESLVRTVDHTFTDSEGYFESIIDITPYAMQLQVWDYYSPDFLELPYKTEHPDSKVYCIYTDGNGKELEHVETWHCLHRNDGRMADYLQPPTDDIINIKYYDANNDNILIHEMTIDLGNKTVIEN